MTTNCTVQIIYIMETTLLDCKQLRIFFHDSECSIELLNVHLTKYIFFHITYNRGSFTMSSCYSCLCKVLPLCTSACLYYVVLWKYSTTSPWVHAIAAFARYCLFVPLHVCTMLYCESTVPLHHIWSGGVGRCVPPILHLSWDFLRLP
jgi:hypothetical protein